MECVQSSLEKNKKTICTPNCCLKARQSRAHSKGRAWLSLLSPLLIIKSVLERRVWSCCVAVITLSSVGWSPHGDYQCLLALTIIPKPPRGENINTAIHLSPSQGWTTYSRLSFGFRPGHLNTDWYNWITVRHLLPHLPPLISHSLPLASHLPLLAGGS